MKYGEFVALVLLFTDYGIANGWKPKVMYAMIDFYVGKEVIERET